MNRTVRNGLAIAGMAGGMWFLGQAVAQADVASSGDIATSAESSAAAEANGSDDATAASSAGNESLNVNIAADVDNTEVSTGPISTGNEIAVVNANVTGAAPAGVSADDESMATSTTTVDNHNETDIKVDSSVNGSNNPVVNNGPEGNDSVVADGDIESKAVSSADAESNDEHHGKDHHKSWGSDDAEAASEAFNENTNINGALDLDNTEVTTGAIDTGNDIVVVNENVVAPVMNCSAYDESQVTCTVTVNNTNITNIHVVSSVNDSNNPVVGNTNMPPAHHPGDECECHAKPMPVQPVEEVCVEAAPVVTPVVHKPAMRHMAPAPVKAMSSAQPTSQLAYTGADVSVPLAVGLLTLTAGLGLAFATRRHSEAQAA